MEDPFPQTPAPDGQDIAGRGTARQGVTDRDEVRQEDMVTYGNAGSDTVRQEGAGRGTARHAAGTAAEPGGRPGPPEPGLLPGQDPVLGPAGTGGPAAAGRTDVTGEQGGTGELGDLPGEDDFPRRERVEPMRPDGPATGRAGTPGALDDPRREPAGARPGAALSGYESLASSPFVGDQGQVQQRWQEIQSAFVDDPRGSVTRAADLADTVVQSLLATVQERKRALRGAWDAGETGTEELRTALRSYRILIDRLSSV